MSELYEAILEELRAFREQRPPWVRGAAYDDCDVALDPLDRRERERLARLYREERQGWRERTRERVARERNQPWRSEEGRGIRRRLWRERRDEERQLLDVRETAILEREEDLRRWLPLYKRRLAELVVLEPETAPWCASMARTELELPSVDDLSAVWERYRAACTRHAELLVDRLDLRQQLDALADTSDEVAVHSVVSLVDAPIPSVAGLFVALLRIAPDD